MNISLVMIVRNEEKVLDRCLRSATGFVDEIVIADTGSTDGTLDIARAYGARISSYRWNDHFADARNFALSQSRTEWNLVLDADEYIMQDCAQVVRDFMAGEPLIGRVRRIDAIQDDYGMSRVQSFIPRIFPSNVRYVGRIHEQVEADLRRKTLPIDIYHDGYLHARRSERNIPLLRKELAKSPEHPYYLYQLAKEYKGMEDLQQSYTHFRKAYQVLTKRERYAPNVIVDYLYLLLRMKRYDEGMTIIDNESGFLQGFPDFHFVCGVFLLDYILADVERNLHLLPRIEQSYLQCLAIGEQHAYDSVMGTGSYAALYNLGNYYEVQGASDKAADCYRKSADYGFDKAKERLKKYAK